MKHADLHPRFIVDEANQRQSVILSLSDYEALMEEIEDLAAVAERREEPSIDHQELLAELRQDGLL